MSNPFCRPTSSSASPLSLKFLLGGMAFLTLACAFFPPLSSFFGLSQEGIDHFFFWQWLTYSFFESSPRGFDGSLFIQLGFSLYMIWIFGTSLIERLGLGRFFFLFFGSALFGGLGAWAILKIFHLPFLFINPAPALYGCLFAWTLLNAGSTILLFFTIPFNAARALYVLIAIALLISLAQRDWAVLAAFLFSLFYAYLFTLLSNQIRSPFSFLHRFESTLLRVYSQLKSWTQKKPKIYRSSKIYDIHSGKPILDDEQFLDTMLTQISLYGENRLSPEERKRMDEISKNRKRS